MSHRFKEPRERRTVTSKPWGVSVTTGTGIEGAILHVYKEVPRGGFVYGEGDKRRFKSPEAAWKFAFEHGYTQAYEPKRHFENYVPFRKQFPMTMFDCPNCRYRTTSEWMLDQHRKAEH